METLKYKVITSDRQYNQYCRALEKLVFEQRKTKQVKEEIALLTVLIEKWDSDHSVFHELSPVDLLKSLMSDHQMTAAELAKKVATSPGLVSDILHYKKGLSKRMIRELSELFKVSQEAFNRPYPLIVSPQPKPTKVLL
jgi:HTH-type transcriptional regulator / antitoxin HigA